MHILDEYSRFKNMLLAVILLLFLVNCTSPNNSSEVNWVEWSDWAAKEALGDKKGFIWIHSPGCDDCIEMGRTTFAHPVIVKYMNEHYHAAKLDINFEGEIETKGKVWKYIDNIGGGGYHELGAALVGKKQGEQISYPAVVFLDENFNSIIPISQQLNAKDLELLLAFVEGEHFRSMSIDAFKAQFQSKITE